jgi:hypothetical protein
MDAPHLFANSEYMSVALDGAYPLARDHLAFAELTSFFIPSSFKNFHSGKEYFLSERFVLFVLSHLQWYVYKWYDDETYSRQ